MARENKLPNGLVQSLDRFGFFHAFAYPHPISSSTTVLHLLFSSFPLPTRFLSHNVRYSPRSTITNLASFSDIPFLFLRMTRSFSLAPGGWVGDTPDRSEDKLMTAHASGRKFLFSSSQQNLLIRINPGFLHGDLQATGQQRVEEKKGRALGISRPKIDCAYQQIPDTRELTQVLNQVSSQNASSFPSYLNSMS